MKNDAYKIVKMIDRVVKTHETGYKSKLDTETELKARKLANILLDQIEADMQLSDIVESR